MPEPAAAPGLLFASFSCPASYLFRTVAPSHPAPRTRIALVPLRLVDHPLVQDALMELRDVRTAPPAFRRAANRISVLLAAEALREVPSAPETVQTPLGP